MRLPNGLPQDVPEEFAESNARFTFQLAEPQEAAGIDNPIQVGGLPAAQLEAAWESARRRQEELMKRVRGQSPGEIRELQAEIGGSVELAAKAQRIIGICGLAGSGKNAVAGMIPGAFVVQLADPLYAMVFAMTGIPEPLLRQRGFKESPIPWLGQSVRQLLQTLGTEWGRRVVCEDVWIRILDRRIKGLAEQGIGVIAVCDVRFDNEVEYLKNIGGEVWHVRRPGCQGAGDHASEAGVTVAAGDKVIENAGTMDELRAAVDAAFGREA